jgi:hypothetical protein
MAGLLRPTAGLIQPAGLGDGGIAISRSTPKSKGAFRFR